MFLYFSRLAYEIHHTLLGEDNASNLDAQPCDRRSLCRSSHRLARSRSLMSWSESQFQTLKFGDAS